MSIPRKSAKLLVAFANTVTDGRFGVLFIGIRDDGKIEGVPDTDAVQKKIGAICDHVCYPPVTVKAEVLDTGAGLVVAIVVPESKNRPHFSGPAYIRRGAQSVPASDDMFADLVYSKNDKVAELIRLRDAGRITVRTLQHKLGEARRIPDTAYATTSECLVMQVDPHRVRLRIMGSDTNVAEPIEHITISYDEERHRPMLVITGYH